MKRDIIILRILITLGIIKLVTVIALLTLHDPQVQYTIRPEVTPTSTIPQEAIQNGALMPLDVSLSIPQITSIGKNNFSFININGTGSPDSVTVLYILQTSAVVPATVKTGALLYTAPVNPDGTWSVKEDQQKFALSEGTYTGTVFAYYPAIGKKSPSSDQFSFTVKNNPLERVVAAGDTVATYFVVAAACISLIDFFILLRKKKR